MQKQISDGKEEDSNAISRIFLNRRQGAGHLMPSCSSPFPVFGNRVNNTYIGSKQWNQSIPDKRAQQDRGVRTTLSLHGSHCLLFLSREVTAYSSCLEATNSLDFWASYHPRPVTPAPQVLGQVSQTWFYFLHGTFCFHEMLLFMYLHIHYLPH